MDDGDIKTESNATENDSSDNYPTLVTKTSLDATSPPKGAKKQKICEDVLDQGVQDNSKPKPRANEHHHDQEKVDESENKNMEGDA